MYARIVQHMHGHCTSEVIVQRKTNAKANAYKHTLINRRTKRCCDRADTTIFEMMCVLKLHNICTSRWQCHP